MSLIDYVFRSFALCIVWAGLAIPAMSDSLFMPSDVHELLLGIAWLGCGLFVTVIIWCGPEIFRARK